MSGDTSFVPLSLADAMTSTSSSSMSSSRTYMSMQASHMQQPSRRQSNVVVTQSPTYTRSDQTRLKAKTMLRTLGIESGQNDESRLPEDDEEDDHGVDSTTTANTLQHETTTTRQRPSSMIDLTSSSSASSSSIVPSTPTTSDHVRLRTQIKALQSDKRLLKQRIDFLEKDRQELKLQQTKLETQLKDKLGDVKLHQLEQSFADQEALLAGYQKELENSAIQIETHKRQIRRLTDFLSNHFGPNWQKDLDLSLDGFKLNKQQMLNQNVRHVSESNQQFESNSNVETTTCLEERQQSEEDKREVDTEVYVRDAMDRNDAITNEQQHQHSIQNNLQFNNTDQNNKQSKSIDNETIQNLLKHLKQTDDLIKQMSHKLQQRDLKLLQIESNSKIESDRAWDMVQTLQDKLQSLES
ncbi:hypothetical protein OIO90_000433 [Microbotryomycetes sp. JL221]|nr:hypothetical protein OIO90_000433 [Microbotryomycetes sp. JL221]